MLCACSSRDFQNPIKKKESPNAEQPIEVKIDKPQTEIVNQQSPIVNPSSIDQRKAIVSLFESRLMGHTETDGWNDSPEIRMVLAPAKLTKEAYCAATVSWLYTTVGVPFNYTAWSPNLFPKDNIIYRQNDALIGFERIQIADVAGFYVASKKRIGHVGIFKATPEPKSNWCYVCEGNTSQKDKEGFFIHVRSKREIYRASSFINNTTP